MPKRVLFLCTGNSCRSQMAEAIVNHTLRGTWQAVSAGMQPAGFVHPLAIQVLAEMGIYHAGVSKGVDGFRHTNFDLVITLCDEAAEDCPVWLGKDKRAHLGFPDPAKASGTPEQVLAVFRQVRDAISEQVVTYLRQITENDG